MEIQNQNNLTDKQWLEIFPEFTKSIPQRIKDLNKEKSSLVSVIKKETKSIKKNYAEKNQWFWRERLKVFEVWDLLELERQICKLKKYLAISKGRRVKGRISDEVIQIALSVPIEEVAIKAGINLRRSGRNFTASCPFHRDRTPSFYLYSETNSYHCFSCGSGGNVVNLVQQFYKYSFKGAVEYLTF